MTLLAKLKDNVAQLYSQEDFLCDHPNISLTCDLAELPAEDLARLGLFRIQYVSPPACDPAEEALMTNPVLKDGVWSTGWLVRKKPLVLPPVTPRQIRQALTRLGLRDQVEAAVAAADRDVHDWWEFSASFERSHPQVLQVADQLGQSSDQIDALWLLAADL